MMSATQEAALALQLRDALFPVEGDPNLATYAIIDGAACPELLPKLEETQPDCYCLYAGDLDDDVAEVAPYLIRLEHDHPFTIWLVENIKSKPWGIFCKAPSTLREMRKHLRTFLLVKSPEGKTLYFRYYDPRIMMVYLPTCQSELKIVFGDIVSYYCSGDGGCIIFEYLKIPDVLNIQRLELVTS